MYVGNLANHESYSWARQARQEKKSLKKLKIAFDFSNEIVDNNNMKRTLIIVKTKANEMKQTHEIKMIERTLMCLPAYADLNPPDESDLNDQYDLDYKSFEIVQMLGCTTDKFRYFLKNCFNLYVDDETITYDTDFFPAISAICAQIYADYDDCDHCNPIIDVWTMFDLRGDDDVDYNASYIHSAIDYLLVFDAIIKSALST